MRRAFDIMRNRANAPGTCFQNFCSDVAKLRMRGWAAEQGGWQWDPLPASCVVKWNVPFPPEALGPGTFRWLQEGAIIENLELNMRQRIRA